MENDGIGAYLGCITEMLERIVAAQRANIEAAAQRMADCILAGKAIYAYGPGHAGIFTEELLYRSGGLAVVNPLFPEGTLLSARPVTRVTDTERTAGFGSAALDASPAAEGDLLLIHSMAGRSPAVVEMARRAVERGIFTVALVNMAHAERVTPLDVSGKMLYDTVDLVIDTCGTFGDTCVELDGLASRVGAGSTVACAFIANALVLETCRILLNRGVEPPVLVSANTDTGRAHNDRVMETYRGVIHYLDV